MGRLCASVFLAVAAIGVAVPAFAQDTASNLPKDLKLEKEKKDGWDLIWNIGAGTSMTQNDQFVGQPQGIAATLQGNTAFQGNYFKDEHEWRNSFGLNVAYSYNPTLPGWLKTADLMQLESLYQYKVTEWFGPFARLAYDTSILPGFDRRSGTNQYIISKLDGSTQSGGVTRNVVETAPNGDVKRTSQAFDLTNPFAPSRLKQSVGVFLRPVSKDDVTVEFLPAVGARETFAKGALFVKGPAADADIAAFYGAAGKPATITNVLQVLELDDVFQVGPELIFQLYGTVLEGKMTYKVRAEAMMPLARSGADVKGADGLPLNSVQLTNFDVLAALSFKLVSWASIDYQFRFVRQPQVVDANQIQNSVLVNFQYALFERKAASTAPATEPSATGSPGDVATAK